MKRGFGTTTGFVEIDGEEREVEVLYSTEFREATRRSPAESSLRVDEVKWADRSPQFCIDEALFDRNYEQFWNMADRDARSTP